MVVDAVDACHQSAQLAVVHLVEQIELDGSTMLDVESHHACLAVGVALAPDVVQGIERTLDDGHGII